MRGRCSRGASPVAGVPLNGQRTSHDEPDIRKPGEYAALTGFIATANGFRFTVLGLFLATAGFVLRQPSQWTTLLVAILTILLWAAELRTRRMLLELLDRARELEGEDEERFAALLQPKENRKNRILSHTTAINLTYLVVFAYSAVVFVVGPEHFQPPANG
jgi:hypothetical protein